MKLQFFSIDALEPHHDQATINDFCSRHRIVSADKHLVERGGACHWVICFTYLDASTSPAKPTSNPATASKPKPPERQLQVKPDTQINHSTRGVAYCGYRILPGAILLSRRKRQRYQQLRLQWEQAWQGGQITELELQQGYNAAHAITLHADSLVWRKQNLQHYPPPAI